MKLTCPKCGAWVPARDINVKTMTAVCEHCDTLFSFKPGGEGAQPLTKNRPIAAPHGVMKTSPSAKQLKIQIFPRGVDDFQMSDAVAFLALPVAVWLAYLYKTPLVTFILVGIGLLLLYHWLLGAFNYTIILVDAERLKVIYGPLPQFQHDVPLSDVRQVVAEPVANRKDRVALKIHIAQGQWFRAFDHQKQYAQYTEQELDRILAQYKRRKNEYFFDDALLNGIILDDDGEILRDDSQR